MTYYNYGTPAYGYANEAVLSIGNKSLFRSPFYIITCSNIIYSVSQICSDLTAEYITVNGLSSTKWYYNGKKDIMYTMFGQDQNYWYSGIIVDYYAKKEYLSGSTWKYYWARMQGVFIGNIVYDNHTLYGYRTNIVSYTYDVLRTYYNTFNYSHIYSGASYRQQTSTYSRIYSGSYLTQYNGRTYRYSNLYT